MTRDDGNNIVVTQAEFDANPVAAIGQALNGTAVHVTDDAGKVSMSIYSLNGHEEERKRLANAVVEVAKALRAADRVVQDAVKNGTHNESVHFPVWNRSFAQFKQAVDALEEHERKAGGA